MTLEWDGMDRRYSNPRGPEKPERSGASDIIKAALIAGITGVIIHVFSIPRLEGKIDSLTASIIEIKEEQRKMRSELYQPRAVGNGKLASFERAPEERQ